MINLDLSQYSSAEKKLINKWTSKIEDLAQTAADYYVNADQDDLDYIEDQGFATLFEFADDDAYMEILDADDDNDTLFEILYEETRYIIDKLQDNSTFTQF